MSVPQVLFIIFAALMLLSSFGVVLARNQVYAAMSLVASMFFLAAIYALLSAHTIAILQVLVYAGAIVVLFLFVIMLLSIQETTRPAFMARISPVRFLAVLASALLAVCLVAVSLNASTTAVVKSVAFRDGAYVVTFDHTPFRGSLFAASPLGKGEGPTTHFDVISVGMQNPPQHIVQPVASPPQVGDVVQLLPEVTKVQPNFGTITELGSLMYSRYLLPFEVTSLLLLVAIVGAVVVAKGKI